MKLKNRIFYELVNALRDLDVTADKKPYKFSATTRYTFAINLRRVVEHLEVCEETRKKTAEQFAVGKGMANEGDIEKLKCFNEEWEKFLDAEANVKLRLLSFAELNVADEKGDGNEFKITTLTLLDYIVKGDRPGTEEKE